MSKAAASATLDTPSANEENVSLSRQSQLGAAYPEIEPAVPAGEAVGRSEEQKIDTQGDTAGPAGETRPLLGASSTHRRRAGRSERSTYTVVEYDTDEDDDADTMGGRAGQARSRQRRRSIVYALLAVLLLATAGGLLAYFVLIPHFAQSILDKTSLIVDTVELTDLAADGRTMRVHVAGRVRAGESPLPFLPPVDALTRPTTVQVTDGANGPAIGTFLLPALSVRTGEQSEDDEGDGTEDQTFEVDSRFEVVDAQALKEFAQRLMTDDQVSWNVIGRLTVDVLNERLSIRNLHLNKPLPLTGMSGLRDIKLLDYNLPKNAPEGGIVLTTSAIMRNPSNMGLSLTSGLIFALDIPRLGEDSGKMEDTMQMAILETEGPVSISPYGMTRMSMRGRILPHVGMEKELEAVSRFFSGAVTNKSSPVVVRCLGTRNHRPKWLDEALGALAIDMNIPPQSTMDMIDSLKIFSLGMDFTAEPVFEPVATGRIQAGIVPPFEFPLQILALKQDLVLYDVPDRVIAARQQGLPFAELHAPFTDVSSTVPGRGPGAVSWSPSSRASSGPSVAASFRRSPSPMIVDAQLPPSKLKVYPETQSEFSHFMQSTFENDQKKLRIRGTTSALVNTSVGVIRLDGIKLDQTVTLQGMASLRRLPARITTMDLTQTTANAIQMRSSIQLFSPGNVDASLGPVVFDLLYCDRLSNASDRTLAKSPDAVSNMAQTKRQCSFIGAARSASLKIAEGWNRVDVVGKVFGSQGREQEFTGMDEPLRRFLGLYMSGLSANLTVRGNDNSTAIPSLAPLLSTFELNQEVPPIPGNLIGSVRFHAFSSTSSFVLNNTLDLPLALISLRANATFRGHAVGRFRVDLQDPDGEADDNDASVGDGAEAFTIPPKTAKETPHWKVNVPLSGTGYDLIKEILKTGGWLKVDLSVRCYVGVGGATRINGERWKGWMEGSWKDIEMLVVLDV